MTVPVDHLTEMLRGLRLDGVDYSRCQMAAPWGVAFPQTHEAYFHFVSRGNCWLKTSAGEWLELQDGDAVLLPRGAAHVLASEPETKVWPVKGFEAEEVCKNVYCMSNEAMCGEGRPGTLLFFGSMYFNIDSLHPLLGMMPDVMRTHELEAYEPAIPHLLEAMGQEVALDRVGAGGIMARLADVLAATIIRAWVESGCGTSKGWVAAARCPQIGKVLAAVHAHPETDWTVESLAELMGASRSGFAQRFAEVVGETPARYVAQVRMHQARQWLARDRLRIAIVAQRLGYESEASFSRAFKRITGAAPSQVRSAGEAPPAAMFAPSTEAAE